MRQEIRKEAEAVFRCEECGLKYRDKDTANKCEKWCRKHQSCNIEIIKEAIEG